MVAALKEPAPDLLFRAVRKQFTIPPAGVWLGLCAPHLAPAFYRLMVRYYLPPPFGVGTAPVLRFLLQIKDGETWHWFSWTQNSGGPNGVVDIPSIPLPVDYWGGDVRLFVQPGPNWIATAPLLFDITILPLKSSPRRCILTNFLYMEPIGAAKPDPGPGGVQLQPLTNQLTLTVEKPAAGFGGPQVPIGQVDLWVSELVFGAGGGLVEWRRLAHPYGPAGVRSYGATIAESDAITIPIPARTYGAVSWTVRGFEFPMAAAMWLRIFEHVEVP
jgi:hypothetical protein